MNRILVIGTSGSGKSTLARRIATRLSLPYVATDPFYWESGWRPAAPESVNARIDAAIREPAWVLDGNFDEQRARVWPRADAIVWLDYDWATAVSRVIVRNVKWALRGEKVWSGDRMTWRRAISGIRHAVRSHRLKRQRYPGYLSELSGVRIWRFRNSGEAEAWLSTLCRTD